MTTCPECNGTGQRDSGGVHPWGEPIHLACDCKDAEIGRQWREDSSLAKWFPLTAERLAVLEAENAALKREAHTWWTACAHATKEIEWLTQEVRRFRADADKWQAKAEALGLAIATVAKSDGA